MVRWLPFQEFFFVCLFVGNMPHSQSIRKLMLKARRNINLFCVQYFFFFFHIVYDDEYAELCTFDVATPPEILWPSYQRHSSSHIPFVQQIFFFLAKKYKTRFASLVFISLALFFFCSFFSTISHTTMA